MRFEHGLDGVLVLGVRDEQVDDASNVPGEIGAAGAVGRVELPGGVGHREQLGADALVDVAVEVERHGLDGSQDVAVR